MISFLIIIILILVIVYLCYRLKQEQNKPAFFSPTDPDQAQEISETVADLRGELRETQQNLNLILDEWNWGSWKPKTAEEFIGKFKPWIDKRLEQEKNLKEFLKEKGVKSLSELEKKLENPKEESEEIANLKTNLDQAKRDKWEAEQDLLATNNRLNNKVQELNEKEKDLARVKQEASEKDKALNDKIKDLRKEIKELKKNND